jgi:hypothetical protein
MPEKDIRKHSFAERTVENWNSLPDSIKTELRAGNIQAETEAIESLAGRDKVGDSNSDSDSGLDIKKAKRNQTLHILRDCWTETTRYLKNNRNKTNNKLIQVECLPCKKTSTYIDI